MTLVSTTSVNKFASSPGGGVHLLERSERPARFGPRKDADMRTMLLVGLALTLGACGADPRAEAFKDGFPRTSTVELKVPAAAGASQPLTAPGVSRAGLEGDPATFYAFTRAVTDLVNGAVVAELSLLERIVANPPTSLTDTGAVWGPYTDPLARNTWRFTVTRRAADDYAYSLEGKGKTEPDSAFRVILSGTHVSAGRAYGHGSFLVDWSAASTLPDHDASVGTGAFTYARPSAADPVTVDAAFAQVRDVDSGQLMNAGYRFSATPGQGGVLDFQLRKDLVGGSALELLAVRSRWLETGAGRADVQLTQGDLSGPATASECWDSNFLSRYFVLNLAPAVQWGTSAACAFPSAEYASF
jgi:hypothetical protein